MTSPYQRNKVPRGKPKPKSDGDIPLWQLVMGGIFITVGAILVGIKIAEVAFPIWMPEILH
jgi:hypothetical protein